MTGRVRWAALLLLFSATAPAIAQNLPGGASNGGSTAAGTKSPVASGSSTGGNAQAAAPEGGSTGGAKSATPSPKVQSLTEIRRQTLQFGIDSQILDLLGTLNGERTTDLDPEIADLIGQSANTDVQSAAINYLDLVKDWRAADAVRSILQDYASGGDEPDGLAVAAVTYLRDARDSASAKLFAQLVTGTSRSVAESAIDAIGKSGDASQVPALLSDLKSTDFPSELKPQVVLALGDLKAKEAVSELTGILQNPDEDLVLREYACDALGRIGDPGSLDTIIKTYRDKNSYLRSYAVSSLGGYSGAQVNALLIQALRDDFWRVRVAAAESLGKKKATEALAALEYKAQYDPEPNVQRAAVTALGALGSSDAFSFLQTLYSNDFASPTMRLTALDALVANDLIGSLPAIQKVIDKEWPSAATSPLLDYTCKQLSQAHDPALSDLYVQFLAGPTINIKIYGIRGIANNHLVSLRPKIDALAADTQPVAIRQVALSALNDLK